LIAPPNRLDLTLDHIGKLSGSHVGPRRHPSSAMMAAVELMATALAVIGVLAPRTAAITRCSRRVR